MKLTNLLKLVNSTIIKRYKNIDISFSKLQRKKSFTKLDIHAQRIYQQSRYLRIKNFHFQESGGYFEKRKRDQNHHILLLNKIRFKIFID